MSQTKAQLIDAVDGSIVTADLADDAVNADKLASNSVVSASIVDGSIVNADINASAAIDGSKISPSFTSNLSITREQPIISFNDSTDNPDYYIGNIDGSFRVRDTTNNSTRLDITSSTTTISNNLDVGAGIDVTGNITATGTLACGDITSSDGNGNLTLKDNNHTGNNTEHKILFSASDNTELINFLSPFGEQHLRLRYGTTELVKFQIDGKVGIGTVSPSDKLTISSGNLAFIGGTNDVQYIKFGDSGDDDIGNIFYYHGNNNMVFTTNASEAMRIDSYGNVGIGTTSPTFSSFGSNTGGLEISDVGSSANALLVQSSSNEFFFANTSSANYIYGADNVPLIIGTNASERMRIDSSGNVGIGTTSPAGKLNVVDTSNDGAISQLLKLGNNSSGSGTGSGIQLGSGSGNAGNSTLLAGFYDGTGTSFTISTCTTFGGSQSEKFRITNDGKVGINIASSDNTSPVRDLDIASSTGAILRLISTDDSLGAGERVGAIEFFTDDDDSPHVSSFISAVADPSDSFGRRGALRFGTRSDSGDASEKMRLDHSGSVGIGTTTPSSLHSSGNNLVVGSGSGEEGMTIYSGNSSSGVINFADGTSSSDRYEGRIIYSHNNNHMTFHVTDGAETIRIVSGGRLFVGCTGAINMNGVTTGHTFQQVENYKWILGLRCEQTDKVGLAIRYAAGGNDHDVILFVKDTTVKFVVHSTGNVANANNSYGQTSDVNLKENIVDANSQWTDIKNVKVRNFNFKTETGLPSHTQIGVVAQEIETTSPKLVTENEQGIKEVSYSVLYMKAIKALQEAMARIETLETEVAALKAA